MKLLQSKNYGIFVSNPNQRKFKPQRVGALAALMKRDGFKISCPVSVSKLSNGKLQINTGHHRVAAAKIAGVPIWYIIEHSWTLRELADEGRTVRAWPCGDIASGYAKSGNKDYTLLLHYVERGIPLKMAASMLRGEHAASGNAVEFVSAGTFKVKDTGHIDLVCESIEKLRDIAPESKSNTFISALSALLLVDSFSPSQMVHKIKLYPTQLTKAKTRDQMLDQIEELYNFSSRTKDNVAFKAREVLRSRNAVPSNSNP